MNSDANSMTILTHFSITNKKFIFRNIISILIWLNRTLMPIIRKLSAFTRCAKFIIKFTRLRWETENIVMGDKICWWQERVRGPKVWVRNSGFHIFIIVFRPPQDVLAVLEFKIQHFLFQYGYSTLPKSKSKSSAKITERGVRKGQVVLQ